jgi:uncharacterized membrane protein
MLAAGLHYFPLSPSFLLLFVALLGALVILVLLHVLRYAYVAMGIAPQYVFLVLFASLIGSYVNIPILAFPGERVLEAQQIDFFGMRYVIPIVRDWPGTIVAVNVGGAVIPTLMSLYLVMKNALYGSALIGVVIVSVICHMLAEPVPGIGIAIPVFIPPLATAIVAIALSRRYAAPLAYVSGSLGTLIGADLMNLGELRTLGAPVASIGGAGTFDGIFVTGLTAVLLASLVTPAGRIARRS